MKSEASDIYPQVFEEYQSFIERYGDLRLVAPKKVNLSNHTTSVVPTRYFLGRPETGEELQISIEKGKMLIIRLMAVGPVVEGRTQRDVWFEVNGEVHDFLGLYIYKLTHIRFERYRLKIKTPL